MTDSELPKPFGYIRDSGGVVGPLVFQHQPFDETTLLLCSTQQVYTYAQLQAAIKQEREAILEAIDDLEEKPWYGYDNPNTFQDAKWDAMAAIRARSEDREGS